MIPYQFKKKKCHVKILITIYELEEGKKTFQMIIKINEVKDQTPYRN